MTSSATALGGTLVLYLLATVLVSSALLLPALPRPNNRLVRLGRLATCAGAVTQGISIGLRCAELHRAPFVTPAESLALLAWMLVLIFLTIERRWHLVAAGPFASGLAFLLVFLADRLEANGTPTGTSRLLSEQGISLHITAILAAFGAFALAFCCAILYLLERRLLKSKMHLAWMKRLPPLVPVERAALVLVAVGFPLLTLGILSGLIRAGAGGLPPGWITDPKTVLAIMVWIVYGIYLVGRLGANWHPARAAYVLLAGLACCLAVLLVPTAAHRFH